MSIGRNFDIEPVRVLSIRSDPVRSGPVRSGPIRSDPIRVLPTANFSYISLQNAANRLYEKTKVGSARRVTRLDESPFFDGRVTLLAGPTFLHINTLARSAGTQLHVSEIEIRVLSLKRTLWLKLLSKKLNLSQQ